MQKFWTFGDSETSGMHIQASSYFLVALLNLGINALLLYILVQYVALWYLFAQVLIDGLLAISSFLIYKFVIFNRREIKAEEGAML
jgi:putative flippase GtrA